MKKILFSCFILASASSSAFSNEKVKAFSAEDARLPVISLPKAQASLRNRITLPEGAKPTEGMNSVSLFLKEINVVGFNIYSKKDLEGLVKRAVTRHGIAEPKYKGIKPLVIKGQVNGQYRVVVRSDVLLSFAYLLGQEITKFYQDGNYFLSRAVIPVQEIDQKNGQIELCTIEGRISKNLTVVTKGSTPSIELSRKIKGLKSSIFNRLKKMTQTQTGALQFGLFERQLLLVRDLPGVGISTTFRQPPLSKNKATSCTASLAQGAGVTDLSVAIELDQFDGAISIDNYGTEAAGPGFLRLNFGANSQVFSGDRYALDVSISDDGKELKNYGISSSIPLNTNGTSLKASYREGDAAPGADFSPLQVDNKTRTISMGLENYFKRSRRENASFSVGLKHQNIDTNLLGVQFLQDRIRSLNATLTYDFANNSGGIHYGLLELSKGLDTDNATQKGDTLSSRPEAEPKFAKVAAEYRYYKRLKSPSNLSKGRLTWVNSLKAQYANEPLYASEEFELGGRNYGRGADVGVIAGDRGVALKSQLDYEYKLGGGDAKFSGFVDYGKAWNLDTSNIATDDEVADLTTAGFSFGYESEKNWYLNFEVAKPVQISGDRSNDANAYLGLGYRF